jgi:hypothetical protein
MRPRCLRMLHEQAFETFIGSLRPSFGYDRPCEYDSQDTRWDVCLEDMVDGDC